LECVKRCRFEWECFKCCWAFVAHIIFCVSCFFTLRSQLIKFLCFLFFEFWGFWKIRQNTCEGWVLLGSFLYLHLHVKSCSPTKHSCVFLC
jgi:hypothetical protein